VAACVTGAPPANAAKTSTACAIAFLRFAFDLAVASAASNVCAASHQTSDLLLFIV
jgi:hypothetical protein